VKSRGAKASAVKARRVKAPAVKKRAAEAPRTKAPKALHPVLEFFVVVGILIFAAAVTSWLSVT
jgi:hypothetical protein